MAIQPVSQVGEKVIRAKAKPVRANDKVRVKKLIADMVDTMRATNLIGIAAPQIGVGLQMFVTEIRATKLRAHVDQQQDLKVFINPRIISTSKQQTIMEEGCGSLCHASLFGPVRRPAVIEIEALDEHFKKFTLTATGLFAKCLQHEYDHLQGIVILDKFTDTRKCWVKES